MNIIKNLRERWLKYSTHNIFNLLRLFTFICMILSPFCFIILLYYHSIIFLYLFVIFSLVGIICYKKLVKMDKQIIKDLSKTMRLYYRHLDR